MSEATTPIPTRTITYGDADRRYEDELVLIFESGRTLVWAHVLDEKVWMPGGPTDTVFIEDRLSGVCLMVVGDEVHEWDFATSSITGNISFKIARKR
jgi:hypothetical protein